MLQNDRSRRKLCVQLHSWSDGRSEPVRFCFASYVPCVLPRHRVTQRRKQCSHIASRYRRRHSSVIWLRRFVSCCRSDFEALHQIHRAKCKICFLSNRHSPHCNGYRDVSWLEATRCATRCLGTTQTNTLEHVSLWHRVRRCFYWLHHWFSYLCHPWFCWASRIPLWCHQHRSLWPWHGAARHLAHRHVGVCPYWVTRNSEAWTSIVRSCLCALCCSHRALSHLVLVGCNHRPQFRRCSQHSGKLTNQCG